MSRGYYLVCPSLGWAVFLGSATCFPGELDLSGPRRASWSPMQSDVIQHALSSGYTDSGVRVDQTKFRNADVVMHMLFYSHREALYVVSEHVYDCLLDLLRKEHGSDYEFDVFEPEDLAAFDPDRLFDDDPDEAPSNTEMARKLFGEWRIHPN